MKTTNTVTISSLSINRLIDSREIKSFLLQRRGNILNGSNILDHMCRICSENLMKSLIWLCKGKRVMQGDKTARHSYASLCPADEEDSEKLASRVCFSFPYMEEKTVTWNALMGNALTCRKSTLSWGFILNRFNNGQIYSANRVRITGLDCEDLACGELRAIPYFLSDIEIGSPLCAGTCRRWVNHSTWAWQTAQQAVL